MITGKFGDFITNSNLVRKCFTYTIFTESWLTDEFNFVLEFNGYKSYTMNRVGRTGGGIQRIYLEFITSDLISHFSVK